VLRRPRGSARPERAAARSRNGHVGQNQRALGRDLHDGGAAAAPVAFLDDTHRREMLYRWSVRTVRHDVRDISGRL
jgi:hypothetical protein